jgi:hypothetical protein
MGHSSRNSEISILLNECDGTIIINSIDLFTRQNKCQDKSRRLQDTERTSSTGTLGGNLSGKMYERKIQHILLAVDVTIMEEASYMLLMCAALAVILLQSS